MNTACDVPVLHNIIYIFSNIIESAVNINVAGVVLRHHDLQRSTVIVPVTHRNVTYR